jgi:hypothetical protein
VTLPLLTRQQVGRSARAQGERLEDWLDAYHQTLARDGVAYMRRVGAPISVLGRVSVDKRGRHLFRAAWDGYQGVDFVGHDAGGRHIALEAKTHSGPDSWDCGVDPSGRGVEGGALQPRQWRELQLVAGCAGLALIVLQAWDHCYRISPALLAEHVARVGRRTVRPSEVESVGWRLSGVRWFNP